MQQLKSQFLLRDDITYLNFASFGACPRPVFEKYQQLQRELEAEPVSFITDTGMRYLTEARKALGDFINCDKDDVVYVTNPSYAVNALARSLGLKAGDEVLSSNLEYGACDKAWDYYCNEVGATYRRQPITLPLKTKNQFCEDFFKGLNAKTKLVFLSHITSSTALRLPVEEVIARAKKEGVPVFIDGAHAPGQIPLDMRALDADYYTGACHKWMMTAKGSSFFYVKKELQKSIDPLVISWGYKAAFPSESQFLDYHQMNGTRDYTAFLTIPAAIEFMNKYDWETVSADCRKLVQENAVVFCELLGTTPLSPVDDDFMLQMCSAEIKCKEPEKLHNLLLEKYHIQVPVPRHGNKVYLRYSINAFNDQGDLDALFKAIRDIKETTSLIK